MVNIEIKLLKYEHIWLYINKLEILKLILIQGKCQLL